MENQGQDERKVAVITGAASGLGAALAHHANTLGYDLALADIAPLDGSQYENAMTSQVDVTQPDQMEEFAQCVYGQFDRCDYLFNNAGIMRPGRSWDQPRSHWDAVMAVNFSGTVNGVRAFAPRMTSSGRAGRIVNTASLSGLIAAPGLGAYGVSKHAVIAFSEILSMELSEAGSGIDVSVICAGAIDTDIMTSAVASLAEGNDAKAQASAMQMALGTKAVGAAPSDIAKTVFEQADQGRFWIRPLNEPVGAVAKRAAQIEAGDPPVFSGWE